MLVNVSYNNKEITQKVDELVGRPYSLRERFKRKGIGSPRMVILKASVEINNLLILDSIRNYCNIEIRPNGIILGFRSLLESYALVIPFYKLSLFKGDAETYSVFMDHHKVTIEARNRDRAIHRFMSKVLMAKAEAVSSSSGPI